MRSLDNLTYTNNNKFAIILHNTPGDEMKYNVYKLFKSGRRAKAPTIEFNYAGKAGSEYFATQIKPTLTTKMQKNDFIVIRADLPQLDEDERSDGDCAFEHCSIGKTNLREMKRVVVSLMSEENKNLIKNRLAAGLVLCEQSEWKWQWAALELATNHYIEGVSPLFKSHKTAVQWMNDQVVLMK